jgi:hypothetical protein
LSLFSLQYRPVMSKHLYHFAILLLVALIPFFLGMMSARADTPPPAADTYGAPTFLTLGATQKGKTITLLARTAWPAEEGKSTDIVLRLWTEDGPITPEQLKPTYGKPLHLFLLSPDFREFYHLTPFATPDPGQYRVSFIPRKETPYRAWVEFMTDEGLKMAVADVNYEKQVVTPLPQRQIVQIENGKLKYSIDFDGELVVGKPQNGMIVVSDKLTRIPYRQLEPVLGTFGQVVAFGSDFMSINHVPTTVAPDDEKARGGPAIYFRMTPMHAGMMTVFGRFRINGRDVIIPFAVHVGAESKKIRSEDLENKSRSEHQDPPEKP